jgi:hypothetical protein
VTTEGDEPGSFDWIWLVSRVVHPIKVAIIEAMKWVDSRLSPTELSRILEGKYSVSRIAYHVEKLESLGVLEEVGSRQVGGSVEHFFFFTEELR